MGVGTLINQAAGTTGALRSASWTADNTLTPNGGTKYLYICSWAFYFKFVGNYAFFGSPNHQVTIQYWNGSSWITASGPITCKNTTRDWDVNCSKNSVDYRVHANSCIWRIKFYNSSGYYKGQGDGYLTLYGYGNVTNYSTYLQGRKLRCSPSTQWLVYQSSDAPPTSFSIYNFDAQRGNPIYDSIYKCRLVV